MKLGEFPGIDHDWTCPACDGQGALIDYELNHHFSCDGYCSERCPIQEEILIACELCLATGIPPIPYSELIDG